MKKIRVMHVLNTGTFSGAESVVINIIKNMEDYVEAFYVSLDGNIKDILVENEIKHIPIKKLNLYNLKKAILTIKPDIIHAHDFTASIVASFCMPKVPIISHIHNNNPWIKKINIYSILYLLSTIKYKKIITVSDSIKKEYIFGAIIANKIECMSNPIDLSVIKKKSKKYVCHENSDLIFVGRLSNAKNPELLFEIIKKVVDKNNEIKVAIVGEGELFDSFYKKITTISSKNIKMYGFVKNPYPIMLTSKVLCLPSKWEGFGLVAVEALALGLPVVCSGVGGLKNIVNNESGAICGNDVDAYVNEIELLLNDAEYYNKKHNAAIKQSEKIENIKPYIEKMYYIYKSLIE